MTALALSYFRLKHLIPKCLLFIFVILYESISNKLLFEINFHLFSIKFTLKSQIKVKNRKIKC